MSTSTSLLAARIGGLALLALVAARPAAAEDSASRYQRIVLGNTVATAAADAVVSTPDRVAAGGAVAYLVESGRSPAQAAAEARALGERTSSVTILGSAPAPRDGLAAYARIEGLSLSSLPQGVRVRSGSHS